MKFKKIVGFGDSWMYGDELVNPEILVYKPDAHCSEDANTAYREEKCFLGLLGKHFNVPTENFGLPGGSMQSSIWTFLWWLEHETLPLDECLILIGHTDSDRLSYYNPAHVHYSNDPLWNKFIHSTWVEYGSSVIPEMWRTMVKQQLVLTNCPEFCRLNYMQTAMFFDGVAARKNLNMMQFHIMPADVSLDLPTEIWPGFCTTMWFRDHPGNQRRELIMPGGHPNLLGHEMIRDKLISTIESATM
jgi:hypothetical protein